MVPVAGYMLVDTEAACMDAEVAEELGSSRARHHLRRARSGRGLEIHRPPGDEDRGPSSWTASQMVVAGILDKVFQQRHPVTGDGHPVRMIGLLERDFLRHGTFTCRGAEGRIDLRLDLDTMGRLA